MDVLEDLDEELEWEITDVHHVVEHCCRLTTHCCGLYQQIGWTRKLKILSAGGIGHGTQGCVWLATRLW